MAPPVKKIEKPNIMEHPQLHGPVVSFGKNTQWSTIGDLHGNVMNFIYFAVHRGAMKISPQAYRELADIYHDWSEAKEPKKRQAAKARFKELIAGIEVAPGAKLRLIGDELCDRGMSDDLTLEALARFKDMGGTCETMLSNHTAVFIEHIEEAIHRSTINGKLNHELFKLILSETEENLMEGERFTASFRNLQYSVQHDLTTVDEILNLYKKHKKSFKAFSYDTGTDGRLIIYSHAAISKRMIRGIAKEMKGEFKPGEKSSLATLKKKKPRTDEDMIPIINAINRVVTQHAENNTLSALLYTESGKKTKLDQALWMRDDPGDNTNNVHGHDDDVHGNRVTLNGSTGRADFDEKRFKKEPLYKQKKLEDKANIYYVSSHHHNSTDSDEPPTDPQLTIIDNAWRWSGTKNRIGQPNVNKTKILEIEHHLDLPYLNLIEDPWNKDVTNVLYGHTGRNTALMFTRGLLENTLPYLNMMIDPWSHVGKDSTIWRILSFPLRVLSEAIKLPVMIASGTLGLLIGICAAPFISTSARWWTSLASGLSDGLRPFAPNAAHWIVGKSLQQQTHFPNTLPVIQEMIKQKTEESWSSTYLGALVLSTLMATGAITAFFLAGKDNNKGMLSYLFNDVLGKDNELFGAPWLYISGTMLVGGLATFMSGILSAYRWLFSGEKKKHDEVLVPDATLVTASALSAANITDDPTSGDPIPGSTSQALVFSLREEEVGNIISAPLLPGATNKAN
ncbi:MAG: hypothetical protein ACHQAX_06070 [Gammaproteobacteria bacterium]